MTVPSTIKKTVRAALAFVVVGALAFGPLAPVSALVQAPKATAKVSFTFDDGLASAYTLAAPTLAKYGLNGTNYVISGCVGMTTTPNTCRANTSLPYMTWAQIQALQNTYGWEIGSHTADHKCLASNAAADPGDCQANTLTTAQVDQELSDSKTALTNNGLNVSDFAPPYGDYSNSVLAEIAKYYATMRQFKNASGATNVWPYSDYFLQDRTIQEGIDTVASLKTAVDNAITNNQWLILTFHDIANNPSKNADDYQYGTSELDQIAAYVKTKIDAGTLSNVTVNKGLVTSDSNLFANSSFDSGIANGWTTNTPSAVTLDTANHGSYNGTASGPTNSVAFNLGASNAFLESPQVPVSSTDTYMLKSFLNVTARTSGEIGYYIDEYDSAGNWISGQWKKAENSPFVEEMNFTYTPSSANVKKASLQVYGLANSGIKAYVDNFQMFSLSGTAVTPPSNNLLTNSTFDSGLTGFTTDNSAAYVADNANHGSTADPVNSVKLTAQTPNAHLFSNKVNVKSTSTYTGSAYLNLLTRTSGQVAFYMDEYDANGNWISGQYVPGKSTTGAETYTFSYIPSSANVSKASVQVILTGASGITGYLDDLKLLAPAGETTTPAPTNLVTNGTFDSGLTGWTTDGATNITADSASHGSPNNAVNSVKMVATTANKHLFSSQIPVSSTHSYTITSWLNVAALTSGEVGYYIDEYDSAGNWISGQYKAGVTTVSSGDHSFSYTPSSANVAKASLQVILVGNSGVTAYFDDVRWFQN